MPSLVLKPTHKPVKNYYAALQRLAAQGATHEGAVKRPFQELLEACATQRQWTLLGEYEIRRPGQHPLRVDAALRDNYWITHGYWEAKDTADDLEQEARKKFAAGYPQDNILFQSPDRALLFQDRQLVLDADLRQPDRLVAALNQFFAYSKPAIEEWDKAVAEFQQRVPELGQSLKQIIEDERRTNPQFVGAFNDFANLCRASLNPNLRDDAVEEMLIQHLLTERLFRKVFDNPEFVKRNAIAQQIEKVIDALSARSFSRDEFLGKLTYFYRAIEDAAATITDFSQKQKFLNTIYEKFFQGFCVKVADTHGIVYTPVPIVEFMVNSVECLLKEHFGKSIASPNVHILDPFAGTDNFHVHLMQHIPKTALPHKYANELWTNEIMLLPYYVGCMNIEHAYYEATGQYLAFPGACLVDTFETAEKTQHEFGFLTQENVERVKRQKAAPIFVIISNPPYNAWQANENDNNKNRKYAEVDRWVAETYAADSRATNKNSLSDPYVKAIRWASNRIGDEGIVAFVTNNGFIDGIAADGMRKHLAQDFSQIIHINLKGNAHTSAERRRQEAGNVFYDAIRVGVGISFFIRRKRDQGTPAEILMYSVDDYLSCEAKLAVLEKAGRVFNLPLKTVSPSTNHLWLTAGMSEEFDLFLPLGSKEETTETIFRLFSNGVKTNRDAWAWNFNRDVLAANMKKTIETYNDHVLRWPHRSPQTLKADDFVTYDPTKISWSESLKNRMTRSILIEFHDDAVRAGVYRPFTTQYVYFEEALAERRYRLPSVFPTAPTENRVIWLKVGSAVPMFLLMVNRIPEVLPAGGSQCFPFYTYAEDGTGRRENITGWALEQFRRRYQSEVENRKSKITKWDIFHYVYAVLHHPEYRARYAANLRRELPRIPFVRADIATPSEPSGGTTSASSDSDVFWEFVKAGKRLAELHTGFEQAKEYPLERRENPDAQLNWRVEKMRLSKDKSAIVYNGFLTLAGIPKETFDYRLGNRSALEWVIDQYQVSTDKRSGITNDPNRPDDPQYIVRLVGQIITVSLETMKVLKSLPALED